MVRMQMHAWFALFAQRILVITRYICPSLPYCAGKVFCKQFTRQTQTLLRHSLTNALVHRWRAMLTRPCMPSQHPSLTKTHFKKRKRITMVFDTCSIYCTCFSVSDGCSGFSVDVTCLDRARMSHATGELSANLHACSR